MTELSKYVIIEILNFQAKIELQQKMVVGTTSSLQD